MGWFQENDRLHYGKRGRVRGRFRAACLSMDPFHLGEGLENPVLNLKELLGFRDGNARNCGGHVKERPFVQGRHEFRSQPSEREPSEEDHCSGCKDDRPGMPEDEFHSQLIHAHEKTADRVFFLAVDASHQKGIDDGGAPPGPEAVRVQAGEKQPDGRVQGDGQHRGNDHGEVLGEGERFEEPPFLGFESENQHEGDGDDEECKKAGTSYLFHCGDNDLLEFSPAPFSAPMFQLLVGLLHDDDSGVHHGPDGDGNAAEGHDVGRDSHAVQRDEGDDDGDGNREDGNDGAGDVPEEDEDDETDDESSSVRVVLRVPMDRKMRSDRS